jgi:hypothetical protein
MSDWSLFTQRLFGFALGAAVFVVVAFVAWWFEPDDGSWRD